MEYESKIIKLADEFNDIREGLLEADNKIGPLQKERRLLEKKGNIAHSEINRLQIKGVMHPDVILDYCFRHSNGDVFDKIPVVNEFLDQIKELQGEKMLTVKEGENLEIGIISGEGMFSVERSFRHLHVPVERYQVFELGKENWKEDVKQIWINGDIFEEKRLRIKPSNSKQELLQKLIRETEGERVKLSERVVSSYIWNVDYPGRRYAGGLELNNWFVYLGDDAVESGLEKHSEMKIPETIRKIPSLNFD